MPRLIDTLAQVSPTPGDEEQIANELSAASGMRDDLAQQTPTRVIVNWPGLMKRAEKQCVLTLLGAGGMGEVHCLTRREPDYSCLVAKGLPIRSKMSLGLH